jgi:hypothetical protein
MLRRPIAYLATPTLDGRIIQRMTWPHEVRVILITAGANTLFGWATDFAVEHRHGVDRVMGTFTNLVPGLAPEIDVHYDGDPATDPEGRLVWASAHLLGIHLGHRPAWHGLVEK